MGIVVRNEAWMDCFIGGHGNTELRNVDAHIKRLKKELDEAISLYENLTEPSILEKSMELDRYINLYFSLLFKQTQTYGKESWEVHKT